MLGVRRKSGIKGVSGEESSQYVRRRQGSKGEQNSKQRKSTKAGGGDAPASQRPAHRASIERHGKDLRRTIHIDFPVGTRKEGDIGFPRTTSRRRGRCAPAPPSTPLPCNIHADGGHPHHLGERQAFPRGRPLRLISPQSNAPMRCNAVVNRFCAVCSIHPHPASLVLPFVPPSGHHLFFALVVLFVRPVLCDVLDEYECAYKWCEEENESDCERECRAGGGELGSSVGYGTGRRWQRGMSAATVRRSRVPKDRGWARIPRSTCTTAARRRCALIKVVFVRRVRVLRLMQLFCAPPPTLASGYSQ
ncbi:hypothetical protein B0H17DRAFT_1085113 [Mycena rosella]|uniref:Uncharacterized protein n=1 Tax=Mycena rosella TaxID=1033263 RepID=A0AAD7CZB5_MYCRO|nr:hypothetical protein B0H17DRAFT_1085113 [Mycena rosella]